MGDVQEGLVDALVQFDQLGTGDRTQSCVQIRQWFIHQERAGIANHGPRQCDTLSLTARQLSRSPVE